MPQYVIFGADRDTGDDVELKIESDSESGAAMRATAKGVLVERVEPALPTPSTDYEAIARARRNAAGQSGRTVAPARHGDRFFLLWLSGTIIAFLGGIALVVGLFSIVMLLLEAIGSGGSALSIALFASTGAYGVIVGACVCGFGTGLLALRAIALNSYAWLDR